MTVAAWPNTSAPHDPPPDDRGRAIEQVWNSGTDGAGMQFGCPRGVGPLPRPKGIAGSHRSRSAQLRGAESTGR